MSDSVVSVIVPAYNEVDFIRKSVKSIDKYLSEAFASYEIIIVEDGSKDGTKQVMRSLCKDRDHILGFADNERRGKGYAVKKGVIEASFENIVMIDADIPVSLDTIETVVDALQLNDIVIGSRYLNKSDTERRRVREFLTVLYNKMVDVLLHTGVSDHQSGLKGFKNTEEVRGVFRRVEDGFFWDTEFIVKASRNGMKIKEIPVVWKDNREDSSVALWREIPRFIYRLFILRFSRY